MKFIALREYEHSYEIDVKFWFKTRTYYRYKNNSCSWYNLATNDFVSPGFGKTQLEWFLIEQLEVHKYNKNKKLISASTDR